MTGVRVRRSSDVLERTFAGEVLITNRHRGEVDRLEGTAAVVWALLDDPWSLDELIHVLADGYGADEREIERDVRVLIEELEGLGYMEVVEDA